MTLHWKDPNKLLLKLLQQTVYKEIIVYNNKSPNGGDVCVSGERNFAPINEAKNVGPMKRRV